MIHKELTDKSPWLCSTLLKAMAKLPFTSVEVTSKACESKKLIIFTIRDIFLSLGLCTLSD